MWWLLVFSTFLCQQFSTYSFLPNKGSKDKYTWKVFLYSSDYPETTQFLFSILHFILKLITYKEEPKLSLQGPLGLSLQQLPLGLGKESPLPRPSPC